MNIFNKVKNIFWKPKNMLETQIYSIHRSIHTKSNNIDDMRSIRTQIALYVTENNMFEMVSYIMNYHNIKKDISYISKINYDKSNLFYEAFDFVSKTMNEFKEYHNINHVVNVVINLITLILTNIILQDNIFGNLDGFNYKIFFIFMAAIFHDVFHTYGLPDFKNEEISYLVFSSWWKNNKHSINISDRYSFSESVAFEFVERAIIHTAPSCRKNLINSGNTEVYANIEIIKMLVDADIMSSIFDYNTLIYNSDLLINEMKNYSKVIEISTREELAKNFIMNLVPEGFISIPGKIYQVKFENVKNIVGNNIK